jgi:alpha-ribazole phosphatase
MTDSNLLVARHAPVAIEGVCYGQSDVPALVDAQAAADRIVSQLGGTPRLQRVWASPWARSREPAVAIAAILRIPLSVDARLSELHFGAWEGRRYAELESDARFRDWMRDWQEASPPGGERLEDLLLRVRSWRDEMLCRGEAVLAVTHAGVVRALRADARAVPYFSIASEPVEPLVVEAIGDGFDPLSR